MIYDKRYIQFNDLVFDGYDMLSDFSEDVSYKGSTQSYSFRHGSYAPMKNSYLYVEERSVSMTITLKLKKVPCEYREYYARFAEEELGKAGRLWAIKNNELIWAYAFVRNLSPIISNKPEEIVWDVEFVIAGGVWHKADKHKTFLLPYDVCLFMECKGYKTLTDCYGAVDGDCCEECIKQHDQEALDKEDCFCCCVDEITPDMVLCNHLNELQLFYSCDTPFQIVYSCKYGEKFSHNEFLGQKICVDDICESNVIAGRFYSETDIPTDEMTIVISGKMNNPWITINGNTNVITGEYDGALIIQASGDVYYKHGGCEELLDPSVWVIPQGNDYGWTIQPRNNSIIVHLNECCTGHTCVYIQHDGITL